MSAFRLGLVLLLACVGGAHAGPVPEMARKIIKEGLALYGADKYDRLKTLKRQWDPDNFFRMNQNIPPD